jgi:hypothetical protein
VEAMRAVKAALDPTWRLNPEVIFTERDVPQSLRDAPRRT